MKILFLWLALAQVHVIAAAETNSIAESEIKMILQVNASVISLFKQDILSTNKKTDVKPEKLMTSSTAK
jgi:hypothetical protein